MNETLNIEETIVNFLNADGGLGEIKTYLDVPANRPEDFVTVERVGGAGDSVVLDRPLVAIQAWSSNRHWAGMLAYDVNRVLERLPLAEPRVKEVSRNSLVNFPDETGNKGRYQALYEFVTK